MATKTAVHNEKAPDFRSMFNWGLKISDFSELFLVAGHAAMGADFQVRHPGDPVAQTRYVLEEIKSVLEQEGYSLDDVIRMEFTMTKAVAPEKYDEIFAIFGELVANVDVKPTVGTLRVVESLFHPDLMVEYEFWAAK